MAYAQKLLYAARIRRPSAFALGLVLLGFIFSASEARADQGTDVIVTVRDEAGKPMPDVEILLTALDTTEHPLSGRAPSSRKANKKGIAEFPFLPWNGQGAGRYALSIKMEGYYICEFHTMSRDSAGERSTGALLQDDQGKITSRQSIPPLMAKPAGRVKIDLRLAKLGASAQVSPGAGAGAEGEPATPAPVAPSDPLSSAKSLAAQGKYEEAEKAFQTLIASDPRADYEFELARVYHAQEKNGEEKAALLRVLAKDSAYPGAHYMLGKMAYQGGRAAEAIVDLEAEVTAHPDDAASQATLGMAYREAGRNSDAVKLYEGVVVRDPQNADALVSLAAVYAKMGDLKKSEETYAKVAAIDPNQSDQVYFKVGKAIADQQDLSDSERNRAADAFRKALERNPRHAKAHRELAYTLIGLGKTEEAKGHFQSYLEMTPNAPDAATIKQFLKGD